MENTSANFEKENGSYSKKIEYLIALKQGQFESSTDDLRHLIDTLLNEGGFKRGETNQKKINSSKGWLNLYTTPCDKGNNHFNIYVLDSLNGNLLQILALEDDKVLANFDDAFQIAPFIRGFR